MKLFDYSKEFLALKELSEELEFNPETGEVTDNSDLVREMYQGLELSLSEKLDNTALLIKELESAEVTLKNEADRLNKKAKAYKNKVENLRELMKFALKSSDNDKLKTDRFTFSVRKSLSVEIDENLSPDLLPDDLIRIKKEFNKTAIKKALENFESVEGCKLVENESLQIR